MRAPTVRRLTPGLNFGLRRFITQQDEVGTGRGEGETVERMPDPRREQDAADAVESKRTHRQWVGYGIRSVE